MVPSSLSACWDTMEALGFGIAKEQCGKLLELESEWELVRISC